MYPTRASQAVIDRALSVRGGRAELLQAYIDVEPASYNRGFYSVDIRYYYRITAEAFVGGSRPAEISGLAVFDKRVLLFGSEGNAKIFTSRFRPEAGDCQGMGRSNLPEAVVEAVDPIVLSLKLIDPCDFTCRRSLVDGNVVAHQLQVIRRRKTRRAAADHGDLLAC